VEKFGKGEEELGQAQFAALLQEVLQDMADILSENPITVVRDAKLLNGSHLRKVLADEKSFVEMTDLMFKDLDTDGDERLNKTEIRVLFQSQGTQWGLPPANDPETEELYDQVFKAVDTDQSGEVDKSEFQVLMKALLADFAELLRINPILVDVEAAFC